MANNILPPLPDNMSAVHSLYAEEDVLQSNTLNSAFFQGIDAIIGFNNVTALLYTCPICEGYSRLPIRLLNCGHVICQYCDEKAFRVTRCYLNACCVCRTPFNRFSMSEFLPYNAWPIHDKILHCNATLTCFASIHDDISCNFTGDKSQFIRHEKSECEGRIVKCPNVGCSTEATMHTMRKHYSECSYLRVQCPTCNFIVRGKDVAVHDCLKLALETIKSIVFNLFSYPLF